MNGIVKSLSILTVAWAGWAAMVSLSEAAPLRAGASRVEITPQELPVIQNGGFLEATVDRIADPLWARCLILDDGDRPLAMIVVDSCMMPREFCDEVKTRIAAATGIATDRILLSATHTHTAPSVMDFCLGSRADQRYTQYLPDRIVAAVVAAQTQLQEAEVGWGRVDAGQYTNCRRWITQPDKMLTDPFGEVTVRANMHPGYQNLNFVGPSGPTDPWLTVLSVRTKSGSPLALLANFSMHYFGGHPGLSSDYCGRYAYQIEQQLGGGQESFVAIMSQGTSGDLWWGNYAGSKESDQRDLEGYVRGLVEQTKAATEHLRYVSDAPLQMSERRLTLKRRTPSEPRLAWAEEMLRRMGERRPQNQAEVYAEQAVYLHQHPTCEVVLQAIRVGDGGITALPNEVYGLTGLKLKNHSPISTLMNIELANGASGYIPPPEQHRLGGYNTWPARTAGLEVQAEPIMVEQLLQMLEELSGQKRREVREFTSAYASSVLSDQPVAYYRLAEMSGDTALDATAQRHDAKFVGNVAFYLPGSPANDAPSELPPRSVHLVGGRLETAFDLPSEWTIEAWCWNGLVDDARATTGTLFALTNHGTTSHRLTRSVTLSGTAQASRSCLMLDGQIGSRRLERHHWHLVAWVQHATFSELYLDGTLELKSDHGVNSNSPAEALQVSVGGDGAAAAPWEGRIDEVAIYPRPLTAEQIRQHFVAAGN